MAARIHLNVCRCPKGASDRDGVWADKENFALLIEELSRAFAPLGLLLSAAVPAANFRVNEGYDVPRLAKALDFINVMTYDMHGTWDDYADHHAPLKRRPFDEGPTQNLHADGALSYWVSQGAPANKIIFGIPFYGRNFQLADANNNKPRALIKGIRLSLTTHLCNFPEMMFKMFHKKAICNKCISTFFLYCRQQTILLNSTVAKNKEFRLSFPEFALHNKIVNGCRRQVGM